MQKSAYEMRISDWSSDVCSSDLKFCNGYLTAFQSMSVPGARVPGKPPMVPLGSISGQYNAVGVVSRGTLPKVAAEFADSVWDLKNNGVVADYSHSALLLHSPRSEERRVGKECVSKGRSRGSPDH